jgi:hypothetical protein
MPESEEPVVRPYVLVGKFAIYIQGGIHHGLWQV